MQQCKKLKDILVLLKLYYLRILKPILGVVIILNLSSSVNTIKYQCLNFNVGNVILYSLFTSILQLLMNLDVGNLIANEANFRRCLQFSKCLYFGILKPILGVFIILNFVFIRKYQISMLLINFDVGNVIRQNAKKKIFVVLQILVKVLWIWYMISIVLNLSSSVNTIKHQCLYCILV